MYMCMYTDIYTYEYVLYGFLPEDLQLVSKIFWLSCPRKLSLRVTYQHANDPSTGYPTNL